MNKETVKGQWKQLKGQVRKQWGKLTDDDLDQIHGDARFSPARFRSATAGPRTRHRKRWIGSSRPRRTSRSTGRGCEPPTIELHSIVPSRGDMPHAHRRHRRCTELDGGARGPSAPGAAVTSEARSRMLYNGLREGSPIHTGPGPNPSTDQRVEVAHRLLGG